MVRELQETYNIMLLTWDQAQFKSWFQLGYSKAKEEQELLNVLSEDAPWHVPEGGNLEKSCVG